MYPGGIMKSDCYVLDHEGESNRLEGQAKLQLYSINEEFKDLKINDGDTILDAGCGTGLVARYLANKNTKSKIEGCDFSDLRLVEAKRLSKDHKVTTNISYFQSNLEQINRPDNHYNKIVSRYVLEHLYDVNKVAREFHRLVKPGGEIYIVDFDGIFINLHTANDQLNQMLLQLKKSFQFDLEIGRKIPAILKQAGFVEIDWDVQLCKFKGENLKCEYENSKERCVYARSMFAKILGEEKVDHFFDLYLTEMMRPESVLCHNKFMVKARKE